MFLFKKFMNSKIIIKINWDPTRLDPTWVRGRVGAAPGVKSNPNLV